MLLYWTVKGDIMKKFYNLFYGECVLLDESEGLYLVYVPKIYESYIVCTYIDPNGALMGQNFFRTELEARKYYFEMLNKKTTPKKTR